MSLAAAVKAYTVNGTEDEKLAIVALRDQWTTLTSPRVVYRGQSNQAGELDPSKMPLFSTTTDPKVATDEFSDKEGCVWKITLNPGVRILDVNALLGNAHSKAFEKEILVLGGGGMQFKVTRDPACAVNAEYSAVAAVEREVTLAELLKRARETLGEDYDLFVGDPPDLDFVRTLIYPGEKLKGARRRKTRRGRARRKRTQKK